MSLTVSPINLNQPSFGHFYPRKGAEKILKNPQFQKYLKGTPDTTNFDLRALTRDNGKPKQRVPKKPTTK